MKKQELNRLRNRFDLLAGKDEHPDFVLDAAFLALRDACTRAFEVLNLQRTQRYSIVELQDLLEFVDHKADYHHQILKLHLKINP